MMRRKVKQLFAAGMALAVLATNLMPVSLAAEQPDAEPAAAASGDMYDADAILDLPTDWEYIGCSWSSDYATATFNYRVEKNGHEKSVTVDSTKSEKSPTCTKDGQILYTATVHFWDAPNGLSCTETETVEVPKLEHNYPVEPESISFKGLSDLGYEPTAVAIYECTRCGQTKTEEVTDLTYVELKKATCVEKGEGYWVASAGGRTEESALVHPGTTDHDFTKKDAAHVTFAFAENGKTADATIRCAHCDATTTETVTCTAEVTTPATCTKMGTTTYTATCGTASETTTRQDVAMADHEYSATVDWVGTDFMKGKVTYECTRCYPGDEGHFKYEDVDAVVKVVKEPTCLEDGEERHFISASIDGVEVAQKMEPVKLPALGHDFTKKDADHVTFTFAPDGKTAVATIKCSRGDATTTENVICTAEVTTPATCTEKGTTTYTATCGTASETTTRQDVPALGHSFTNYVYNGDATCGSDGTETAKCDRCDATDTIVASNTAHCALHLVDGAQVCPICGKVDGKAALNAVSAGFKATTDTVGLRLVVRVGNLPSGKRIMTVAFVDGNGCLVPVSGICKVRVSLENVKAQLGESDVAGFTHTLTLLNAADGAKTDVGYALENGTLIFDARFDGGACLLQID